MSQTHQRQLSVQTQPAALSVKQMERVALPLL